MPVQLHSVTCNKPVNKFYYSQQQVTQSQQLEMELTAREENQALARYILFFRQQSNKVRHSELVYRFKVM
jgi:hypothetical protein